MPSAARIRIQTCSAPGIFQWLWQEINRSALQLICPRPWQDAAGQKPLSADQITGPFDTEKNTRRSPQHILTRALDDFVVQRGAHQSVIAGYPWFLDWGRDALIFVRGLIAARQLTDSPGHIEAIRSI